MGEFDKNQDKGDFNRSEQGEKPAFGQFDKEQGQQERGQDQREFGETGRQDEEEFTGEKGQSGGRDDRDI